MRPLHTSFHRLLLALLLTALLPLGVSADRASGAGVTIDYTPQDDGTILVNLVRNESPKQIHLYIDGLDVATINAATHDNPQGAPIRKVATVSVTVNDSRGTLAELWRYVPPKKDEPIRTVATPTSDTTLASGAASQDADPADESRASHASAGNRQPVHYTSPELLQDSGVAELRRNINQDPFFGTDAVESFTAKTDRHIKALATTSNRDQYIIDNDLKRFLVDTRSELDAKRIEIPIAARELMSSIQPGNEAMQSEIVSWVVETLNSRLKDREQAYTRLKEAVEQAPAASPVTGLVGSSLVNYCIVGGIVLLLVILVAVAVSRKRKKSQSKAAAAVASAADPDTPTIVVRRRTTSILKKQNIDDVVGNPAYLPINAADFAPDSAVRTIYVKNSCIKEVYNLYAEDLRNTNRPKEDGCMVLGRWVRNEATNTYDVSLEHVILPGDDAVFKEYELNFGGKIKLRIAERLRRLRTETNLQYDLVCWIHSHPGLGVFFSNSDNNVQMQLKHAQHPNFLVAFVIDILTSDQEMGIFTFRQDGTMNSKGDITRMYSLENLYKWALDSSQVSFDPEQYYNLLANARATTPNCKGIELNNSAIIDLTQIVVEPATGIVGWVVGTPFEQNGGKEQLASGVVRPDDRPMADVVGLLLNVTHMSLPTIQRLIAGYSFKIAFVLVYSTRQMSLTAIPVVNGELLTDERYYGDVKIDDLKIWTRRKR